MKRALLLPLLLCLTVVPAWAADQPIGLGDLKIGDAAPDFDEIYIDVRGRLHHRSEEADAQPTQSPPQPTSQQ